VKPDPAVVTVTPEPSLLLAMGLLAVGVASASRLVDILPPALELARGYAPLTTLVGTGVLAGPLGTGLGVKRGVPIWLREREGGPYDGPRPGVGANTGAFRSGDSGRGRDCLPLDLNCGLGGRAPGPTDWENFGRVD
jgi:hypothetical protein